ncbi:ABC transporter ATP-binding protein [Brachybacterium sp. UNK5269]|uniref:ABC transporter ATP-binding protein n=1 Tax=Brachybacterium sp. UNK5269 TaxID=3408576 RepID=UPI003BB14D38
MIGRNGSGKSTLLRTLAGLEAPSSGTVLTSAKPVLLGVGAALIPDLTGAQNVKLGALAMGLSPEQAELVFDEVVELSALGEAIDLPMRTYSSGMGARLKFAISLAADPSILMIDEALATGDASFAERSKRAMDEMLARAGTVFLVNHAAQTIETMCSRAIWMERGQIVLDGDAVEVARKYRWFAHNLAQGEEEKAAGLLRDAVLEGESQRREANLLATPSGAERPGRSRRDAPEFEPDPFTRAFNRDRGLPKRSFPSTILPDDHH